MTSDAVHPLTVEHAPDRRIHPMWLAEIGPDVLVIHPTEAAQQHGWMSTLRRIQARTERSRSS